MGGRSEGSHDLDDAVDRAALRLDDVVRHRRRACPLQRRLQDDRQPRTSAEHFGSTRQEGRFCEEFMKYNRELATTGHKSYTQAGHFVVVAAVVNAYHRSIPP